MKKSSEYRVVIKSLLRVLRPSVYVEVGCRSGETLRFIHDDACAVGTQIYAIDIKDVKSKLPKDVKFIMGDSVVVGNNWDIPIDMLFIDADHSASSVFNDFENFGKWVKQDGIIFLHDTYPSSEKKTNSNECGDCWKAAWAIRQEYGSEFEIVTIPVTNGLSIIRKSSKQVSWH